ncbi:hypothetical protein GWI33_011820 [Rhynchophorus ferrugineus]|uniref:G-protein coupled receptors family 2 profile 2 domain-containing protein n=1 Tax=Rhynchophorus ferrugineus TaxID=354439 RepID=A0A834MEK0_RHYFE|nr:hypothetical protein GWI33_011820 [Rhynchophorus ferrugineus]
MLIVVFYLLICYQTCDAIEWRKCCDDQQEAHTVNDTLVCQAQAVTRYQVHTDAVNFLYHGDDGQCVDTSSEGFFSYEVIGGKLVSKKQSDTTFYKCCPLKYVYDADRRSCIKADNFSEAFLGRNLVQIGLPQCKIISDTSVKNFTEAQDSVSGLEPGSFCLDRQHSGNFIIRKCERDMSICKEKRCFKKCCPDGQSFFGGGICKDTYVHGFTISDQHYSGYIEDPKDDYELIYGTKCPGVSLMPRNTIQYSITKTGNFRYYKNYTESFIEEDVLSFTNYCIEHATKGKLVGYFLFMCYKTPEISAKFTYTFWVKILSCVFLVFTVLIYVFLGETKSTFGKILISYCTTVFFLLATLIVSNIRFTYVGVECKLRAYITIFCHFSTFAWVNIMSLDIWWTFSTQKRVIGSDQRRKDLKKYLLYCLYGWGLPLVYLLLIILVERLEILPNTIHPYIGIHYCIIENRNYGRLLFSHVPQLIFQISNTILFIKTIIYCIRVKNEINKMNHSSNRNEKRKLSADKER